MVLCSQVTPTFPSPSLERDKLKTQTSMAAPCRAYEDQVGHGSGPASNQWNEMEIMMMMMMMRPPGLCWRLTVQGYRSTYHAAQLSSPSLAFPILSVPCPPRRQDLSSSTSLPWLSSHFVAQEMFCLFACLDRVSCIPG
jgi:hypothetical protein